MTKKLTIAEYCKKIRTDKDKNVLAFSEELNCSHSYILNVESGKYNKPTPLVFAKIVIKYGLDLEDFISSIDLEIDELYLALVKRHLQRNIGTKPVHNRKNIITKFYNEILAPMGYKDIDEKLMAGNLLMSLSKYNPVTITGKDYTNEDDSFANGKVTIFQSIDYACAKGNKLCFLCVIGIRSTIVVDVDKELIEEYINQLSREISDGYFDVSNRSLSYDIILLTPSEKVFDYISKNSKVRNWTLHDDNRIDIALVRPKRPIKLPKDFILNK